MNMKIKTTNLLKASAVAVALVGSAAVVMTVAVPEPAFAKGGQGNGGGNGGGKGNGGGNGGEKGNSGKGNGGQGAGKNDGAKGKGGLNRSGKKTAGSGSKSLGGKGFSLKDFFQGNKSSKKASKPSRSVTSGSQQKDAVTEVTTSVRPQGRSKKAKASELLQAHPSELGALNAANASPTALLNASPNSRVGRIAIYRDTVLAGFALEEDLEEAIETLAGLEQPDRTIDEIEDDLDEAQQNVDEKQEVVDGLEQDLIDAGGEDDAIEEALGIAEAELAEAVNEEQEIADELQDAVDYNDAVADVEDLTEQVEQQPDLEREALEDAANKPVTDEVEATVRAMLGLE
jgi:hypothetical protein